MRSLLFAGATRPDLVAKLPRSAPDAVVIDLEDAVPADFKEPARLSIAAQVRQLRDQYRDLELYVRVNGVATRWFAPDMEAALDAGAHVVVPKLEEPSQLEVVAQARSNGGHNDTRLVVGIETVRGVAHVERLLGPGVHAAYFGAEDFIADVGGRRTPGGEEVLYARSRFVLAARLAGVIPVDQALVDVRDEGAFRADARRGRDLGFRGKICVHPRQTPIANEVFGRSDDERERARRLLAAWERAASSGVGAAEFEGSMIDEPALRMARQALDLHDDAAVPATDRGT